MRLLFTWVLGRYVASTVIFSTQTFRRALTASVDSCAEIKSIYPFSGVTSSGRVWRKVPESDARSVYYTMNRTLLSASFWLVVCLFFVFFFFTYINGVMVVTVCSVDVALWARFFFRSLFFSSSFNLKEKTKKVLFFRFSSKVI